MVISSCTSGSTMDSLPNELIQHIYQYLDMIRDVIHMSLVSKSLWYNIPWALIKHHQLMRSVVNEINSIKYYYTPDEIINGERFCASMRLYRGYSAYRFVRRPVHLGPPRLITYSQVCNDYNAKYWVRWHCAFNNNPRVLTIDFPIHENLFGHAEVHKCAF